MSLPEVRELMELASSVTCNDFKDRFLEGVRMKLVELAKQMADLQHLKEDFQRLEAHLMEAEREEVADHTMLECSPESCTCMQGIRGDREQRQEVTLWLNRSK